MEQQRVLGAAGDVERRPLYLRALLTVWTTAVRQPKVRPSMQAHNPRQQHQQQIGMQSSLLRSTTRLLTRALPRRLSPPLRYEQPPAFCLHLILRQSLQLVTHGLESNRPFPSLAGGSLQWHRGVRS